MQVDKFRDSPTGHLEPISWVDPLTGQEIAHYAFVPAPLPSDVRLQQATYKVLGQAERGLGALEAQVQQLPDPRLLVQPAVTREAISTSALEGTYAPLADVLEAEYVQEAKSSAEVREVRDYIRAAIRGVDLIERKPICTALLEQLQGQLVRGTRGDGYDAGRLRQRLVAIGNTGESIEQARFVPVPQGERLVAAMSDWEKWVNEEDDLPLLVKVALGHYQFETIHPFSDGNGRLGRLVITLQLITEQALTYPVLNLSPWLEPRRAQYIDSLLNATITGDFDPWVRFFAQAVAAQAAKASTTIAELLAFRDEVIRLLKDTRSRGVVLDLASDLIGYPRITVSRAAEIYNVTYPAANSAMRRLVDLGVMREITGGTYGRVFACDRVYDLIARA
jgi:Fic family protein